MKNSRFGKTALIVAAVALTASLSVGSALAYFTTYCTASGSVAMDMGFTTTEVTERVEDNEKLVTITNTGAYDCFVRAVAYAPIDLEYRGEGWEKGDGDDNFYYYNKVLPAGESAPVLTVSYELPGAPTDGTEDTRPDEINIVVVYEYSPVFYDEEGNPTADWNFSVQESSTEQGGE